MNKKIEFRAWDIEKKIMVYDNENDTYGYWDGCQDSDLGMINHLLNRKEYIFMQYTGLKDKNGKKIFEGDIVKNDEYTLAVVYNPRTQSFVLTDENEWLNSSSDRIYDCDDIEETFIDNHFEYSCGSYEVIGNIYDNNLESKGE